MERNDCHAFHVKRSHEAARWGAEHTWTSSLRFTWNALVFSWSCRGRMPGCGRTGSWINGEEGTDALYMRFVLQRSAGSIPECEATPGDPHRSFEQFDDFISK